MLRVILIDDEAIALDVLEILLQEVGGVEVAGKFQNVLEAIEQADALQPDLIFLDIEMPGMNGLAAGEQLLSGCPDTELVFVTAYHQYAIEAFETNAIGYLLKPVAKERLAKVLERYVQRQAKIAGRTSRALYLKVFKNLELYGADGRLVTWRTKKTKELFAYLWNYDGEPVYRDYILDHLWPDIDTVRAQALFHTTMYNLRTKLRTEGFPDMAMFGGGYYWIQKDDIRSDSDRLRELMQRSADAENVVAAETDSVAEELLSLYRGDLMETEHYPWADSKRTELRSTYIRLLEKLTDKTAGYWKTQILWKLLELDPFRVKDYDRLLQHLNETGDTAGALKLVEMRKLLERELEGG